MIAAELQVMPLGAMLREARRRMKDKSYRRSPVGREVGRFIRALRWQQAAANTIETYEWPLALLAVEHDDYDSLERFCDPTGTEYLRDFLDRNWGECAPATKQNRTAILRAFFQWATDERLIPWNPAAGIKAPRAQSAERSAYPFPILHRLVSAQDNLRDQCALQLAGRMALRKNELRVLRVGEIDLARDLVTVHGKGGYTAVMPLEFKSLREDLYLHINGEGRHRDEFLLYPKTKRRTPMDHSTVHRWFKRCLERAGLDTAMTLHELRHTAGDAMWRETGDVVKAQQLLRHKSLGTTQVYLHPRREDLAAGMRVLETAWQESK